MRSHLALFSVIPKTLSVLVWTLPFSFRFHEDDAYAFSFGSTFESVFTFDTDLPKMPSVLVWTEGLNASKCMRFQTKTH